VSAPISLPERIDLFWWYGTDEPQAVAKARGSALLRPFCTTLLAATREAFAGMTKIARSGYPIGGGLRSGVRVQLGPLYLGGHLEVGLTRYGVTTLGIGEAFDGPISGEVRAGIYRSRRYLGVEGGLMLGGKDNFQYLYGGTDLTNGKLHYKGGLFARVGLKELGLIVVCDPAYHNFKIQVDVRLRMPVALPLHVIIRPNVLFEVHNEALFREGVACLRRAEGLHRDAINGLQKQLSIRKHPPEPGPETLEIQS
jgi:hypothetical protein